MLVLQQHLVQFQRISQVTWQEHLLFGQHHPIALVDSIQSTQTQHCAFF